MRPWLLLFALVTACGGAAQTEIFGGEGSSSGTSGTSGTSTEPPVDTPPTPPAPTGTGTTTPPGTEPCATTVYYRDVDKDGYGGIVTMSACTSPGAGWVTKGGDCADDNADVFPGQTAYFDDPYSKGGGVKSFDYDCSTKETQKPPAQKAAADCAPIAGGNTCSGSGFVPTQRAGASIDSLCGATKYQTCARKLVVPVGGCEATIEDAETPVSCH